MEILRLGERAAPLQRVSLLEHENEAGLAAGVAVFELGKIMGSSVRMIERHCGALLDGAGAGISGRLDVLEAELEAKARAAGEAEG
jgi:hypothetical protein